MIDQEPGLYVEKVQTDLNTGCLASCASVTPSAIEERIEKICTTGGTSSEDVFDCEELKNWFQDIYSGGSCCGTGSSNLYSHVTPELVSDSFYKAAVIISRTFASLPRLSNGSLVVDLAV